jgi:hypothetical protein
MYLNHRKTHEKMRCTFHLAALTLLIFATLTLVSCGGNGQQTGDTNSGQNKEKPCPSPTPSVRQMGDTPIVVSGGSVHMDVGKDGDGTGTYNCSTCSFKEITVLDNDADDSEDPPPTSFDSTLDWRITLTLGSSKTITLTSLHDGTGVTVTFDEQKNGESAKVHKFKFRKFLGFIKRKDKVNSMKIESKKPAETTWSTPAATLPTFPSSKKVSMVLALNK